MVLTQSKNKIQLGEEAPDFSLIGTDDNVYSLGDAEAYLVVFICNHCPYVIPKIELLKKVQNKFKKQRLKVIGINSNNHPDYEEDDFEHMKKFSEEQKLNFPYLFDKTQEIAKLYGAVCTPDPFLFDKDKKLIYHGRLDNAKDPYTDPTKEDIIEVLAAYFEGKSIPEAVPSMGCSIKWQ